MDKIVQVAVIGLGELGQAVVETLLAEGIEVIACESNPGLVQQVADEFPGLTVLELDATDDVRLKNSLDIEKMDAFVVAIGDNIQASVLTVINLIESGASYVVAKAFNLQHQKVLKRLGVHRVVLPEAEMGRRIGRSLVSKNVMEHIELSDKVSLVEITAPRSLVGKSIKESDVRRVWGINIIGVIEGVDGELSDTVDPDYVIREEDRLLVFGSNLRIETFRKARLD